ncbi:unnamed protein product [Onchocerca ochengi]|uniref:Tyrosine-protein phosphatase domain-containing protein n=1 Tax=Onchocerca ochengi TaxID=42157 RepID=A0A182EN67_ONCOC|nr:unnamed protein product [Onchocerca ochengi]
MRDPVNASDFHINSSHVSHDGQLCANNYPDPRSSQIFETIQESLSGRSSPTKDIDSVGSHEEQEAYDKRKSENNKSIEKKVCKEDNNHNNNEREQRKILSSNPDLEFIPVVSAENRAKIRHEMRRSKSSSSFTSSKNSTAVDNIRPRAVKPDSLRLSNILIPESRIQDNTMKNSISESEAEYDKERVHEDVVASSEEFGIDNLVDEWIETMLSKGVKGLNDEFIALCSKTKPSKNNCSSFMANQNSGRNRYRNVVCLDNSRVKLNNHPSGNDYIHANYISTPFSERRFICTQVIPL